MSKEPNETLVMTTCKCRENTRNLVMTRVWFEGQLANKIAQGARQERYRVVELLKSLPFTWQGDAHMLEASKAELIALIEGKDND